MGVGAVLAVLSALAVLNGLFQALKLGGLLGMLSVVILRQRRGK
jgi:sugar phosphate permease